MIKLIQYLETFFFNLHFAFYAIWNFGDSSLKWSMVGSERSKQFQTVSRTDVWRNACSYVLPAGVTCDGARLLNTRQHEIWIFFYLHGDFPPSIVQRKGESIVLFFQFLCLFSKLEFICIVLLCCAVFLRLTCKNCTIFKWYCFSVIFFIPMHIEWKPPWHF